MKHIFSVALAALICVGQLTACSPVPVRDVGNADLTRKAYPIKYAQTIDSYLDQWPSLRKVKVTLLNRPVKAVIDQKEGYLVCARMAPKGMISVGTNLPFRPIPEFVAFLLNDQGIITVNAVDARSAFSKRLARACYHAATGSAAIIPQ